MLNFFRKSNANPHEASLSLRSADNKDLLTFSPKVVTSFRRMITEQAYQHGLPSRIAVVSALSGEGVTHTTLAFATTLASDMAGSVCVVELNWWRPGLQRHLAEGMLPSKGKARKKGAQQETEAQETPGLAEVITGIASLDEALISTQLPNLALLPAGNLQMERRPVLARSSDLKACIEELSSRFTHLILDVPAILATSDSIALASLGDACVVVVRQGVTPINSAKLALDDLKHLNVLGVVLNQASYHTPRLILNLIPQD